MSTNRDIPANDDTDKVLTHIGKRFKSLGRLYCVNPANPHAGDPVKAGVYFFVQQREEPRTLYLLSKSPGMSGHDWLAKYIIPLRYEFGNVEDIQKKVLSAGEVIIDSKGNVFRWCLKTGFFYDYLDLIDPSDELFKKIGMPKDLFLNLREWDFLENSLDSLTPTGFLYDLPTNNVKYEYEDIVTKLHSFIQKLSLQPNEPIQSALTEINTRDELAEYKIIPGKYNFVQSAIDKDIIYIYPNKYIFDKGELPPHDPKVQGHIIFGSNNEILFWNDVPDSDTKEMQKILLDNKLLTKDTHVRSKFLNLVRTYLNVFTVGGDIDSKQLTIHLDKLIEDNAVIAPVVDRLIVEAKKMGIAPIKKRIKPIETNTAVILDSLNATTSTTITSPISETPISPLTSPPSGDVIQKNETSDISIGEGVTPLSDLEVSGNETKLDKTHLKINISPFVKETPSTSDTKKITLPGATHSNRGKTQREEDSLDKFVKSHKAFASNRNKSDPSSGSPTKVKNTFTNKNFLSVQGKKIILEEKQKKRGYKK